MLQKRKEEDALKRRSPDKNLWKKRAEQERKAKEQYERRLAEYKKLHGDYWKHPEVPKLFNPFGNQRSSSKRYRKYIYIECFKTVVNMML